MGATTMEATATAAFTATARDLLRVRLMPTTATLVSATVTVSGTVMAATAMESVQLMPSPTTATDTADSATAMAATVWVTPTASKTASLLPRTTFKGGAASTEIKKKTK